MAGEVAAVEAEQAVVGRDPQQAALIALQRMHGTDQLGEGFEPGAFAVGHMPARQPGGATQPQAAVGGGGEGAQRRQRAGHGRVGCGFGLPVGQVLRDRRALVAPVAALAILEQGVGGGDQVAAAGAGGRIVLGQEGVDVERRMAALGEVAVGGDHTQPIGAAGDHAVRMRGERAHGAAEAGHRLPAQASTLRPQRAAEQAGVGAEPGRVAAAAQGVEGAGGGVGVHRGEGAGVEALHAPGLQRALDRPQAAVRRARQRHDAAGGQAGGLGPRAVGRRVAAGVGAGLERAGDELAVAHQPGAAAGRQAQGLVGGQRAGPRHADADQGGARGVALDHRRLGGRDDVAGRGADDHEAGGVGGVDLPPCQRRNVFALLHGRRRGQGLGGAAQRHRLLDREAAALAGERRGHVLG